MERNNIMANRNILKDAHILKEALQQVIDSEKCSGQFLKTLCRVSDYLNSLCEIYVSSPRAIPLTLVDLRQMDGQTVYCLDLNEDVRVIAYKKGLIQITDERANYCVTGLTLYRTNPIEFKKLI